MRGTDRGTRALGWAALLLCAAAVIAVAVPVTTYFRTLSDDYVRLDGRARDLVLTPGRRYGIYVDDADNSGYSVTCSGRDGSGAIRMKDPPWSLSSSETEVVDHVFTPRSDNVKLDCDVPGEIVTVRRLPDHRSVTVGVVVGGLTGSIGFCMLVAWLVRRTSPSAARQVRVPSAVGATHPQPSDSLGPPIATLGPHETSTPRDLTAPIIASVVCLPVMALQLFSWVGRVVAPQYMWDDPEMWGGRPPPADLRPSLWESAFAAWSDLLPVAAGVLLISTTCWLAWRRLTRASWVAAVAAMSVCVISFALPGVTELVL